MDDQQRARAQFEAWCNGRYNLATRQNSLDNDVYVDRWVQGAWVGFRAALRAAPDAVALRVAMDTLEQIASAPDDQGARFKAAGAVAFLITQEAGLRGAPEVTDAMVEAAHSTYWAHPDDSGEDRPCIRAALEAALAARPQGVKG